MRAADVCRVLVVLGFSVLVSAGWLGLPGCSSGGGDDPRVSISAFATTDPVTDVLLEADITAIVQAAAESVAAPNMAIAVVDRIGNILRVYNTNAGSAPMDTDNRLAVSIARTAAYLSHSQAPLTSRTGQFISTFHFPSAFDITTHIFDSLQCPPVSQPTMGIFNTPQGPLWQIDASNRGGLNETYNAGMEIPRLTDPDLVSVPSPGLTALPGGIPLYKRASGGFTTSAGVGTTVPSQADLERGISRDKRHVGAIGVYVFDTDPTVDPRPDVAEFAAANGALAASPTTMETFFFCKSESGATCNLPSLVGEVFLVGILLPAVNPTLLDTNFLDLQGFLPGTPGSYNEMANTVVPAIVDIPTTIGAADPEGFLIGPANNDALALPFTAAEVEQIVKACELVSLQTHAAIRLPSDAPCQMVISVADSMGNILAAYRMTDATLFSLEIAVSKARNAFYLSDPASTTDMSPGNPFPGMHPLFAVFMDDPNALMTLNTTGIAVTARSLGFLTQPFFPPTIDSSNITGPLFYLANENRLCTRFDGQGFDPPGPNQSGIIFFPGSAPLYRDGVLIGGIGVSGDGVEQDDFVTARGITLAEQGFTAADGTVFPPLTFDLEPPPAIRCDQFTFEGVAIPYTKFPQNPGG